jgi:hypothetical protein
MPRDKSAKTLAAELAAKEAEITARDEALKARDAELAATIAKYEQLQAAQAHRTRFCTLHGLEL